MICSQTTRLPSSVVPDQRLAVTRVDTACDGVSALKKMREASRNQRKLDALIGPECDYACESVRVAYSLHRGLHTRCIGVACRSVSSRPATISHTYRISFDQTCISVCAHVLVQLSFGCPAASSDARKYPTFVRSAAPHSNWGGMHPCRLTKQHPTPLQNLNVLIDACAHMRVHALT